MRPEIYQSAYAGFSDSSGNPLIGGKLYTYDAGTTTPRTTWTSPTKGVTNANPVILDSLGRAELWCDGNYKFDLRTAADVPIDVVDNVYLGRDDGSSQFAGSSTGGANTYNLTLAPALTEYANGQTVSFLAHQANTGNSTININSLGSRTLGLSGLTNIYPGAIQSGNVYFVYINGSIATLLNPDLRLLTYVPTVTYQGGGSATSTGLTANYNFSGPFVHVDLLNYFTVNSGVINAVRFTLPVTPVSLESAGGAFVSDSSTIGGTFYASTSTTIEIRRYDAGNFTVASNRQVGAQFRYRWA